MPLILDTSVAVALGDVETAVTKRFDLLSDQPILSAVTLVELQGGIAAATTERERRAKLFEWLAGTLPIIDFNEQHALVYGSIVAQLGFSRPRIIDRMIAAQALVAGAKLATLNPRDFRDVPGLAIDDWS